MTRCGPSLVTPFKSALTPRTEFLTSAKYLPSKDTKLFGPELRRRKEMATAYKIRLSSQNSGVFNAGVTEASAQKVSDVLQDNLQRHHIIYNSSGFHSE